MKRAICLLLFALTLAIMPVTAQDEPCQDTTARMLKRYGAMHISNANPCGVLVSFKHGKYTRLYRIKPMNGGAVATPYPPLTTCRNWTSWGVSVIAVDKQDCDVYLRSLQVAPYTVKIKAMKWKPKR